MKKAVTNKKLKLSRQEKRINKIRNKVTPLFGVVPTTMLDDIKEEDFIKAEESPELKKQLKEKVMSIYTIVPTRDEAIEFIRNHIILKHHHHYVRWCELHDHKKDDEHAKDLYLSQVVDMQAPENQYSIININYTREDLGVILRMSAGCAPIGCSFDNEAEIEAFLARESYLKAVKAAEKEVVDSHNNPDQSLKKPRRGRPKKVSAETTSATAEEKK